MKVAFQGTKGSYSEEALYKYFGKDVEAIGIALSEDVCQALEDEDVACAILPIENSIVGNVDINMDLIFKHDFFAIGELYLEINHCLMANPGVETDKIKAVYSHPIALAQCHGFFKEKKLKPVAEFDTAGSAKIISDSKSETEACVGSRLCADYYGLNIIQEKIQDEADNYTRFLIFVKEKNIPTGIGKEKTSIAFTTKHHPGALLGCLQVFASYNINLTKLESRPIPHQPFKYIFYVDFMGALHDKKVQECLKELKRDANDIKILGSYPAGSF
ncbi:MULTISPECIES: prephenate dehydratase [Halobacteriovorax]|uniref:Prephenate dehydratase n=1 Tax=Halobacteriovorax vibrionivorans TaxID=2152716 RepID=A0ABY0IHT3_9BACT|nr:MULTISPECIES: prephenate dehydratase [Halobacteriovorax]AYF45435.1 prephenate dehydratase [Halobacteriovorax sp. BALOs_7]RZF22514.1 prephenate dehydratase [Halobacteriovorax vibrionivorans]TGD47706.1 prephenate dehydratase [Halobacteriovorax sp. Y22]